MTSPAFPSPRSAALSFASAAASITVANNRCTRKPAIKGDNAGFTLLEILVAMTVLTLIVTTAFGALRLGERSWNSGLEQSTKTENLRTVSGVLQRLFAQALPISWKENTETTIAFFGDIEQLRFIGPAPQHHGATGLFEYTLIQEVNADSNRLMLYYRLHDPDIAGFSTDGSEQQKLVLVEGLKSVNFRYFGTLSNDDRPEWHTYWSNEEESFPSLVHAQLVSQLERDQWPDLFLPLHMTKAEK